MANYILREQICWSPDVQRQHLLISSDYGSQLVQIRVGIQQVELQFPCYAMLGSRGSYLPSQCWGVIV